MNTLLIVWLTALTLITGLLLWFFFKNFMALTAIIRAGDDIRAIMEKLPKEIQAHFPNDWRRDTGSAAKKGYH